MSERETDDTTQTPAGSHPQRARRSGRSYYYDDATGYEIYIPESDEEEIERDERPEIETDDKNSSQKT